MAMIDYGALLRVDGKFINKNKELFMESSDTGYVCEKAEYQDGERYCIDGNYYVYAGDEDLLLCFYKSSINVISKGKSIFRVWEHQFISQEYFVGDCRIKVSHLDPELRSYDFDRYSSWENYLKKNWIIHDLNIPDYKKPWQIIVDGEKFTVGKKEYHKYLRIIKKYRRKLKHCFKDRSYRWIAEWDYNGKHYEAIFGSGIDPDEEVWNNIKFKYYRFSDVERDVIDSWFKED